MKLSGKHSLYLLTLLLVSCKTSGDLKGGKSTQNALDPTGIKTLEGPPADSVEGTSGEDAPAASGDGLRRQLVVAQGEVENLRHLLDGERQAWQVRFSSLEDENRKLTEALNAAPLSKAAVASSGAVQNDTVELLWKQVVSGISKKADNEAFGAAKSIVDSYPKSKRLWGATLAAGMLEYRLGNFKEAAIHFNNAIDMTGKRSVGVSLPWYFQGLVFMQLKKKEDASLFLGELQRKYPGSLVARKARSLKKAPADLFADVPNWLDFTN